MTLPARRPPAGARLACSLAGALALAGCGPTMHAGLRTLEQAWSGVPTGVDTLPLDPALTYLRVQLGRQTGLMVLADQAASPRGTVHTWVSADGAVLRLVDGRLDGYADLRQSWSLAAAGLPPAWTPLADPGGSRFAEVLDVQPGYRLGQQRLRERVAADRAPAGHQWRGDPDAVRWFVERNAQDASEPRWYAVDLQSTPARVVYGQACLNAEVCLSWQAWPTPTALARPQAEAASR